MMFLNVTNYVNTFFRGGGYLRFQISMPFEGTELIFAFQGNSIQIDIMFSWSLEVVGEF